MAEIRISDLGSLNFHHDWRESFQSEEFYSPKYLTTDTIKVQYSISKDIITPPTVRLVNAKTDEITIVVPHEVKSTDNYTTYNVIISGLPVGCYYLQISLTKIKAAAAFSIHEELEDSFLLTYTNYRNEFETVFDGEFNFRVEGVFVPQEQTFNVESNDFRDQKYGLHQLSASPYDVYTLRFGGRLGAPNPIGSKINRIFSCSKVLVNGEEFVRSDGANVTKEAWSPAYPLYPFKIQVEKKISGEKVVSFDLFTAISTERMNFILSSGGKAILI